jgi:aryl-alcohol dehydrogenase-like predicted oxidoreductase
MWQVSGTHGQIDYDAAISQMKQYGKAGLYAWDMADIYGPAERLFGQFQKIQDSQSMIGFTKFVPSPGPMSKSIVEHYIDQSIARMEVSAIDLLQFHWWVYADESYLDALDNLQKLQSDGKILNLGLTNFDTEHTELILNRGVKLVSNQVQYSILDSRPEVKMASFCEKNAIKLLCYGVLLGGFLSEKYLGADEPYRAELDTASLQKYKNMIDAWGGWSMFQELLDVLDGIAKKHDTSIANVGTRYVLDKPAVGATIIGARLGLSEHIQDNLRVFSLKLDTDDNSEIKSVTSKANDLFDTIGDCGDEYR